MEQCEILINRCYGGFTIPNEVRDEIFALHPPHTELGSQFFSEQNTYRLCREESDVLPYILVENYEPYIGEYKLIKGYLVSEHGKRTIDEHYATREDDKVWYIYPSDSPIWRTHPDVIRLCKEMGFLEKKVGYTELAVASYPRGYSYRIREYDGMESLEYKPPIYNVLEDMIRTINSGEQKELNPFTKSLLDGSLSLSDFLNGRYKNR